MDKALIERIESALAELVEVMKLVRAGLPPAPVDPVPEPQPEPVPQPPAGIHRTPLVNTRMPGVWDRGVRVGVTVCVQILNTKDNRERFVPGANVTLADNYARFVTSQEVSGGYLNTHLSGPQIDPEVCGAPNQLVLLRDAVADPKPEPVPDPQPEPEPDPKPEPEPEPEPKPEPQPDPVVVGSYSTPINDFGGNFTHGVMRAEQGWAISIKDTPENRIQFAKGTRVVLEGGIVGTVYYPQAHGGNISVHINGVPDLDGNKVGAPHHLAVLDAVTIPIDMPEAPVEDGEGPARELDFDMQILATNFAGHEFDKGGKYYHWPHIEKNQPDSRNFELWQRELGCNTARFPMSWERFQPRPFGELDVDECNKMIAFLDMSEEYGFKILTDLHSYLTHGKSHIGYDLPGTALVDFWQKFTTLCKGHPALWAHGIMNEPNANGKKPYAVQKNGYWLLPHWGGIAQATYNAIQAIEPGRHVAVNGDFWANAHGWAKKNPKEFGFPIKGRYVIHEFHLYPDVDASGRFQNRSEPMDDNVLLDRYKDVRKWAIEENTMLLCGELNLAHDMTINPKTGEPYGSEALRRFMRQAVADKVPVMWWSGGSHWSGSAPNATQFKYDLRFPVDLLREFKGQTTRLIGPFA
ncbi:MAG: hypothetical protein CMJ75_19265 [Planctomycetaceae bacterium]|nr:hypothetical protein [Planctomycetaceae bacterium]